MWTPDHAERQAVEILDGYHCPWQGLCPRSPFLKRATAVLANNLANCPIHKSIEVLVTARSAGDVALHHLHNEALVELGQVDERDAGQVVSSRLAGRSPERADHAISLTLGRFLAGQVEAQTTPEPFLGSMDHDRAHGRDLVFAEWVTHGRQIAEPRLKCFRHLRKALLEPTMARGVGGSLVEIVG